MIIDDQELEQSFINKLSRKELVRSDVCPIFTYKKQKLVVVVFQGDACQTAPNFHVLDTQTIGNRINAAYEITSGNFVLHGSVLNSLSKQNQKFIQSKLGLIWNSILETWNMFNDFQLDMQTPVCILNSNSTVISKQYDYKGWKCYEI